MKTKVHELSPWELTLKQYEENNATYEELSKKPLGVKNFSTFVSLLILLEKEKDMREATFTLQKEPHEKELNLLKGQEKKHVGDLENIIEKIKEKLLTVREASVTLGSESTWHGEAGGRVTFSNVEKAISSIDPKEKIYRNDERPMFKNIGDEYFVLDRVKLNKACLGENPTMLKDNNGPSPIKRSTSTILSTYA